MARKERVADRLGCDTPRQFQQRVVTVYERQVYEFPSPPNTVGAERLQAGSEQTSARVFGQSRHTFVPLEVLQWEVVPLDTGIAKPVQSSVN